MQLTMYQVDAFASRLFTGNPAAVIPLRQWLPEALMQQLAAENNLSETVFFVPSTTEGADFDIRWFTPVTEVNLCGHATLASAWVLFEQLGFQQQQVCFSSKSGLLYVRRQGQRLQLDFPSWKPVAVSDYPPNLAHMLGVQQIRGVYRYRDLLVEVASEEELLAAAPDFAALAATGDMYIVTAPGKDADFVSRFFAPVVGVNEDPVTGSAHSQLVPFWSEKLGKQQLFARQLSSRGGELWCELVDDRVLIAGSCVLFLEGTLELPLGKG